MRIEGPRRTGSTSKSDKAKGTGGSTGAFKALLSDGAEGTSSAAPMSGVSDIGGLLAAQASEDPMERKTRKRMQERAEHVLDVLDDMHKGLVSGQIDISQMQGISAAVAQKREKVNDPVLSDLLDQVDLRAQVELAKLEVSYEKQKK